MNRFHHIVVLFGVALILAAGCSKPAGQREMEKGLRELNRGNYVRAKVLLEKSISARPGHIENARVHNYLGITAWRLGQLDEAVNEFENARRLNPSLIEPIYNLGVLSGEREDLRSASRYLNEAATLNQDDSRPLEYLAELYIGREQWSQARNALYSALDRNPNSAKIHNSIATVHAALGQDDNAIASLMYALEADTRYAPALYNLAVMFDAHKGDAEQAKAYYKRFVSVGRGEQVERAKDALARIREEGTLADPAEQEAYVPPDDQMVLVDDADVNEDSKDDEELSPYDAKIRKAREVSASGFVQQAIDLCEEAADLAAQMRRYDLQERAYQEAVAMALDQPRAHALLGQHLFDRGKIGRASRSFRQAATLNANFAPAQLGLGRIAANEGEMDAAVVHYKKAIASDPSMADAQWELALIYDQNLEMPETAAVAYRSFAQNFPADTRRATGLARAEELAPTPRVENTPRREAGPLPPDQATIRTIQYKKPSVRNKAVAVKNFNRAGVYQEQREWDRATYYYLKSLEHDDQIASVFYNLGICYTMNQDKELARDAYRRALKLDPAMHDAAYNLALLYNEAGEEKAAVKLLEDVVKSDASYASAHYALGIIYSARPSSYDKAKRAYSQYLKLMPNDPSAPVIRDWVESH